MTGTVISGTLKPDDLIPVFFQVLDEMHPIHAQEIWNEYHLELAWCWETAKGPEPERIPELLELLTDALDNCAPEGCYFGAHPGDGSDFGFWPLED
jgi:hypothetical protein